VIYVRDDEPLRVRARQCVLACYNMIIPYLVPDLPETQKAALHELVKAPLVYASVAVRHGRAFHKLGVSTIHAPGCYFTSTLLNTPPAFGRYKPRTSADDPALIFLDRTPCKPGLTEHEQNKAGRAELLATPFETMERHLRGQLGRMLGPGGFDPATDITGITINRWPHGYAPEFNSLFDPLLPYEQQPHVVGRARFGQIAIANSDSGRAAYTDVAIDQAHRAVTDLLSYGVG